MRLSADSADSQHFDYSFLLLSDKTEKVVMCLGKVFRNRSRVLRVSRVHTYSLQRPFPAALVLLFLQSLQPLCAVPCQKASAPGGPTEVASVVGRLPIRPGVGCHGPLEERWRAGRDSLLAQALLRRQDIWDEVRSPSDRLLPTHWTGHRQRDQAPGGQP